MTIVYAAIPVALLIGFFVLGMAFSLILRHLGDWFARSAFGGVAFIMMLGSIMAFGGIPLLVSLKYSQATAYAMGIESDWLLVGLAFLILDAVAVAAGMRLTQEEQPTLCGTTTVMLRRHRAHMGPSSDTAAQSASADICAVL